MAVFPIAQAVFNRLVERRIEIRNDLVPGKLSFGNGVEFLFHIGCEIITENIREILHEKVRDNDSYVLRKELALLCAHGFRPLLRLDSVFGQQKVSHLFHTAALVPLHDITPCLGQSCDGRSIGGRPSDTELFQFLDQSGFGIARRSCGKTAFSLHLLPIQFHPRCNSRKDCLLLVLGFVIAALGIETEKTVKQDFAGLGHELPLNAFCPNPDVCAQNFGISHLRSYGPAPYQLIEPLFLRSPADCRPVDIGRANGFVSLLRSCRPGLVVAGLGIFRAVLCRHKIPGGRKGEGREIG